MGVQQIFYASAVTAGTSWQVWNKPRGVDFVQIFALGGGGGGGGGSIGGNGTLGGGGGASSNQCSLIFPAWALPDILHISVGYGGAGGVGATTGGTGGTGIASFVSIYPANTVNYLLAAVTGGNGAVAGAGGVVNAAATVLIGTAPLAGLALMPRLLLATNLALGNLAGTAGGATIGTALTLPTTGLVVTGGTGGGGMGTVASSIGSAGGAFTVPAGAVFHPQIGGIAGGAQASSGGPGSNGVKIIPNLNYFYGGTGGASAGGTSGTGGLGGAGAYGCGGGGGGAAVTGQVAGNGGRGGDGLVIVTAW